MNDKILEILTSPSITYLDPATNKKIYLKYDKILELGGVPFVPNLVSHIYYESMIGNGGHLAIIIGCITKKMHPSFNVSGLVKAAVWRDKEIWILSEHIGDVSIRIPPPLKSAVQPSPEERKENYSRDKRRR